MRLLFAAVVLLLVAMPAAAQDYRGLRPIASTRADVERVLGTPHERSEEDGDVLSYTFRRESVRITCASGPEFKWGPGTWRAPEGTVLEVEVTYDSDRL